MTRPFSSLLVVVGLLAAVGLSAQVAVPPGIKTTKLADNFFQFDQPASAQPVWWKLLLANLIKPAQSLPFGRSIAFLTGVSQYESLSPRALPAVENDLTDLRNYLLTKGGFDTVYEARNSAVTRNLIEQYMKYEFTSQRSLLGKDDRLLFYYSGHGADQQGKLGYLQFTTAKSGEFFRNDTLAVADFQQMSKVVAAKHLLIVLDSCASGLAITTAKSGDDELAGSLSGAGSGHILTAGYGPQKVYADGKNSVMTRALINALQNAPAGAGSAGLLTVDQLYGRIQFEAAKFAVDKDKKMSPQLGGLSRGDDRPNDGGTFVFLNPNARNPSIPPQYSGLLAPVAKGSGDGDELASRIALATRAYDGLKDSTNIEDLKVFIAEYQNVPGAASLVAIMRRKVRDLESPPPKLPVVTPPPPVTTLTGGTPRLNPRDGLTYVWIPKPTQPFMMGCSPGDTECFDNEKPAHPVTLTTGFWIGQTKVTQAAYERVSKSNPSHFRGSDLPVDSVDWNAADTYCRSIEMRLPYEAEWEYAARAGSPGVRYPNLDQIAWYNAGSLTGTHAVKGKQPNAWNIYDMLGNVWEWVADWYGPKYYTPAAMVDPKGPNTGDRRVLRGGSWVLNPRFVRVSFRNNYQPSDRFNDLGFRCAGELR